MKPEKKSPAKTSPTSQEVLGTTLLIVGAGVRPRQELAEACGLELGGRGGIKARHGETGDVWEIHGEIHGKHGFFEGNHGFWMALQVLPRVSE